MMKSAILLAFVFVTISVKSAFSQTVTADGSSTVYPIAEAVAEEFQNEFKGKYKVTVGVKGTGGGFNRFCKGETDVQNASRPIQEGEISECKKNDVKFIELPIAYDATVVVVNSKNDWLKEITVDDLKKIWEPTATGKVMKWNQINPKWPDQTMKLFGAGTDSGTFDYFTEAIVGKKGASRRDYTPSEDDNTLVQGVSKDKYALGYVPMAYYAVNKNKLIALAIINKDKAGKALAATLPSRETVENGTYVPLSRPIFIYLSVKALKRPEVKEFASFFLKKAPTLVPGVQYVPLPMKAYELATRNLEKGKEGTLFNGHSEIGMKIEDLLKKESKN